MDSIYFLKHKKSASYFHKLKLLQSLIRNNYILELKNNLEERLSEHDIQLMEIYTVMEQFVDDKQERTNWENRKRLGYK